MVRQGPQASAEARRQCHSVVHPAPAAAWRL